jgi:hypothetical protein
LLAGQIYIKISTAGRKKTYEKNFWACFWNLRPQNRPNYGFLLQNYVQKQKSASLKFVTGVQKNFGVSHAACGPQFGHACYR